MLRFFIKIKALKVIKFYALENSLIGVFKKKY